MKLQRNKRKILSQRKENSNWKKERRKILRNENEKKKGEIIAEGSIKGGK